MKTRGLIFFSVLVILAALFKPVLPVNGEVKLYDKLIRLHVIANSDSDEDQALKLAVRDALLDASRDVISDSADIQTAKQVLLQNSEYFLSVCQDKVYELGYSYPVSIEYGVEQYPERSYNDFTLPSGDYYSVRVKIGEAAGQNWWCVMFPPLCVGAAKDDRQTMASSGLDKREIDIITENGGDGYILKFKFIEFLRKTFSVK